MLATLAEVKARLNISGTTDDAFLTTQIAMISDTIEAYCRRVFTETDYIQTFYRGDYTPAAILELFHFPLTAVASIEEDSVVLDTANYRIHKPTGRITRTDCNAFFRAEETVISYTAGFEDIPSIILAVLDSLVQERYNKKTSGVNLNFGSDVQSISIPGAISIDFDYSLNNNDRKSDFGAILGSNLNLLDQFRSERAILGDSKLTYIELDI